MISWDLGRSPFSAEVSALSASRWTTKIFPCGGRGGKTLEAAAEELWPKKSLGFNELGQRTRTELQHRHYFRREGPLRHTETLATQSLAKSIITAVRVDSHLMEI